MIAPIRHLKYILLLLLPALTICIHLSRAEGSFYEIKFVFDGDTILLSNGEKVRYLGINAPEIDHDGGKSDPLAHEARRENINILKGHKVRLELDLEKRDTHGRLLAHVFLDNGGLVSELLLKIGYAHVLRVKPNVKYWDQMLETQRKAMKQGAGIWGLKIKDDPAGYRGNTDSFVFHRKSCLFGKKVSVRHSKPFKTRQEAFFEGFSPCRKCRP
ncbi:MAG: hypothetical protein C4582_00690 [Desulfobacteraceae bacterium]|nr:MAG: hypothetical protein C4582_00690 [Desulfobacteraceae bacterium]